MRSMIWHFTVGCFCLLAVRYSSCLTNREFFELAKQNGAEVTEEDPNDISDDVGDEVIDLPGDPDDELDAEFLIEKMGVLDLLQELDESDSDSDEVSKVPNGVRWWHKKGKHRHNNLRRSACSCRHWYCRCCIDRTFRLFRWRFRFNPCIAFGYNPSILGVELTITFNGRRLFHHQISLRHPPPLCFGIPLRFLPRVCIQVYNLNFQRKSMCIRVILVIFFRLRIRIPIACFRIPLLDERTMAKIAEHSRVQYEMFPDEMFPGNATEISVSDLPELFRYLKSLENGDDLKFELAGKDVTSEYD